MAAIEIQPRDASPADCVLCREALAGQDTEACRSCGVVLHVERAEELGRCPILGCGRRLAAGRARRSRPLPRQARGQRAQRERAAFAPLLTASDERSGGVEQARLRGEGE